MLKKTIKFNDFDGNPQEEDWYFHMSKAEVVVMQMELGYQLGVDNDDDQGLQKKLQEIVKTGNPKVIIETFNDLIKRTVGKRSEDGKRFVKSPEILNDFLQTEAYSAFFMELVTDAGKALEFLQGILPKDLGDKVDVSALQELKGKVDGATDVELPAEDARPAWERENREPTRQELLQMPQEQLVKLMQTRVQRGTNANV